MMPAAMVFQLDIPMPLGAGSDSQIEFISLLIYHGTLFRSVRREVKVYIGND
jgi:hypothetical protein